MIRSFVSRSLGLFVLLGAFAVAPGCAQPVGEDASAAQGAASARSAALKEILANLRDADVATTGGFGRSLAAHLDGVVRGAGSDVAEQRKALKALFGVDLPSDVEPEAFVASMKKAFDLQYDPVLRAASNKTDAINNLAHVDSMVSDIVESLDDIVKNLDAAGIPQERAMDLLLAVAWHDVGKMMDPDFIAKSPAVTKLLESQAFQDALAKLPEGARENFKNKFVLQVLCHEYGSIRAIQEDGIVDESVIKRLVSYIEDHNDGSGHPAAWWNEQWEKFFGVKYSEPKTEMGFLLSALDRARQGSIELAVDAKGTRKLDGGVIKIAYNTKGQGKTLGFAIQDSVLNNNAKSLAQLKAMAGTTRFGELLVTKFGFYKKAIRRNEITQKMLASFVKEADPTKDVIQILDHGQATEITNLDDFFKRLDDNWDELYARASLASSP